METKWFIIEVEQVIWQLLKKLLSSLTLLMVDADKFKILNLSLGLPTNLLLLVCLYFCFDLIKVSISGLREINKELLPDTSNSYQLNFLSLIRILFNVLPFFVSRNTCIKWEIITFLFKKIFFA